LHNLYHRAMMTNSRGQNFAFTLVEVMISVALVLVLILGINQVFRITASTVSSGQALSENVRNSRAVQTVLYNDLQKNPEFRNGPFLLIRNLAVPAYMRREDEQSDRDSDKLTIDMN